MPAAVVSLVAVVGVICLLDLLLTFGVIRRLREHTETISTLQAASTPPGMLAEGETAGEFEAVTTTGEVISRDTLAGNTLVGVFSPDCPACAERLPGFLRLAAAFRGGRDRVLAVIADMGGDPETYRERLEPVARVVIEPQGTGINEALRVRAFPSFGVLDGSGTVLASGLDPDRTEVAVPA